MKLVLASASPRRLDLLARIGVERRVHTSAESKAMLDPFLPEQAEDDERLKRLQAEIHDSFKAWIRQRRGKLLKGDEAMLFTGEFVVILRSGAMVTGRRRYGAAVEMLRGLKKTGPRCGPVEGCRTRGCAILSARSRRLPPPWPGPCGARPTGAARTRPATARRC